MLSSLHWWLRWLNDLCVVKGAISFRELEEGCVRVVVSVRSSCADTEARTQRLQGKQWVQFSKLRSNLPLSHFHGATKLAWVLLVP